MSDGHQRPSSLILIPSSSSLTHSLAQWASGARVSATLHPASRSLCLGTRGARGRASGPRPPFLACHSSLSPVLPPSLLPPSVRPSVARRRLRHSSCRHLISWVLQQTRP